MWQLKRLCRTNVLKPRNLCFVQQKPVQQFVQPFSTLKEEPKKSNVWPIIEHLYVTHGHRDYIGEQVNQIDHAVQCANLAADAVFFEGQITNPLVKPWFSELYQVLDRTCSLHMNIQFSLTSAKWKVAQFLNFSKLQKSVLANLYRRGSILKTAPGLTPQMFETAALLHDIGQLVGYDPQVLKEKWREMSGVASNRYGTEKHEILGQHFLWSLGFPYQVCRLVKNHVTAKRYWATMVPAYQYLLSPASQQTLQEQGQLMSAKECVQFQDDPFFVASLFLRLLDDHAKTVSVKESLTPDQYLKVCQLTFKSCRPIVEKALESE